MNTYNTYVVLLRGVNVGGNNLLPMKALSTLLTAHGFRGVKTYIQSGNIVLKAKTHPSASIAKLIKEHFGFSPDIMVLSQADFHTAAANNPYSAYEGKYVHAYFCQKPPIMDHEKLTTLAANSEQYKLIDNVFYLYAPNGIGRSKLVTKIEQCLAVSTTGRNLNTLNKLTEILTNQD